MLPLAEAPARQAEQPVRRASGVRTLDAECVVGAGEDGLRVEAGLHGDLGLHLDVEKLTLEDVDLEQVRTALTRRQAQGGGHRRVLVLAAAVHQHRHRHRRDAFSEAPRGRRQGHPGRCEGLVLEVGESHEPVQALNPARRRGPGHVGLLRLGAAGGDARKLDRLLGAAQAPRLHARLSLQRPVCTRPGSKARAHVVDAAGQSRAAGAVAELHPGAAVVVLADDVDLGVGALAEQGLDPGPGHLATATC